MHAPSLPGRDGQPAFMARLQFGHTTHSISRESIFTQVLAMRHPTTPLLSKARFTSCFIVPCETMQQSVKVHLPERHQNANLIHPILESPSTISVNPACTKKLTTPSLQSPPQDLTNQTFPSARCAVNDIPPLVFPNSKSDRSQRSEKRDTESASMQRFANHTPRSSLIVDCKMSA